MGSSSTATINSTFQDLEKQSSLITACTLLWKDLSAHFSSLEQSLLSKSQSLHHKILALDQTTQHSLDVLSQREISIGPAVDAALSKVDERKEAALVALDQSPAGSDGPNQPSDSTDEIAILKLLQSFCTKMDTEAFWKFLTGRKKDIDAIRSLISPALSDCIDPARFAIEAISGVFPVDKRAGKSERANEVGWACVLILESLVPVLADPVLGSSRPLVTPSVKERAKEIAGTWKVGLDQRGGVESAKAPEVHTFLQHVVTFGVVAKEDEELYRKLVVAFAWRKQMPKLAISLGLKEKMADIIEELITKGQQVDAVHFTFEAGLVDKFPPVPLLKAYLKDSKTAATSILEDRNNSGRAANIAGRKEQSALRAVIKCIEEYKLEAEYPPESLKKRLEQLEKAKVEKKKPVAAAAPANKRTRASSGGPMPPAKAGRLTNAYVSSFPAGPTFVRSPSSHAQYPTGVPPYGYDRPAVPAMYGSRSPPAVRDPYGYPTQEVPPPTVGGSYPAPTMNYAAAYGGYGNGMATAGYQQTYYR
ncbi:FRIGIDA-like protein 4a [Magnolia sinica]|uniref:FRIGIDA-like protein 4a n=1 Tax=Magnolia sinica TaxID=86752 RepID=UPI0026598023|nr:FRIGIDA-like protein 4a [Magnolia sinica]